MTGSGGSGSRAVETLVQALAGLTAGLRYADIPGEVVRSVRERVLDTMGIELAASRLETSAMARSVAQAWGADCDATSVFWGDPCRLRALLSSTGPWRTPWTLTTRTCHPCCIQARPSCPGCWPWPRSSGPAGTS